ncbi:MAG: TadE/TadG family type IV pilus assembly protein, partial [Longimicrobiales bacterium]
MVEFALILPLLLLFIFGVIEAGHMLAIYSGVSSAAEQTARYGSVAGTSEAGRVYYLDCAGMRTTAKRSAFLQGLTDSNIQIAYDTGFITSTVGACDSSNVPRFSSSGAQMTSANSEDLMNGGRVVVTITTTYRPIVPLVPIPPLPMTFVAARSIFTGITGPTPTPVPPPDLQLAMAGTPNPVAPNGLITYSLTITNTGPGIATSVSLTDSLPSGTTFMSASGTNWSCAQSGGTVTCTATVLAVGSPSVVTIVVRAPASGGTVTNTAGVISGQADPDLTDNSASVVTTVASGADLTVGLSDTPDPVAPSTTLTYTLNVTNTGTSTANSVVVIDTLPVGVALQSATGTGWSCSAIVGGVNCSRATLAVGAAPDITLRVTAPASVGLI